MPTYAPAPLPVADRLRAITGRDGAVLKMAPAAEHPVGYYCLDSKAGLTPLFVKVIPRNNLAPCLAAEKLVARLPAVCPVRRLLPGYPRDWNGAYAVLAYKFVDGRFAHNSVNDMARIGRSIARLHLGLAGLADAEEIRARCIRRLAVLERRRRGVAEGSVAAGPEPERFRRLAQASELGLDSEAAPEAQPIHGDLNYGNVLLPIDGSDPIILDCEDAVHTWGSALQDLALAIERFCLSATEVDADSFALAVALLAAYGKGMGRRPVRCAGDLARAIVFVNLRALCLLAELEANGEQRDPGEWAKFMRLMDQLAQRHDLIDDIERACQ